MADVITEFVNDPSVSYSELAAGYPIVTNTASEQAVVKDLQITNPNTRILTLSVGDTVINTTDTSIKLAGSEIIGSSSALNLKTATTPLVTGVLQFNSTQQRTFVFGSTIFNSETFSSNSTTNTTTSITTATTVYPAFSAIAENGDFYYSDNKTSALYRRAGGINGTQTNLTPYGAGCSYDGRYIYSFRGGYNSTFQVTDTQNNGATVTRNITGPFGTLLSPDTSYIHSAAIDGYVWVHTTYNSTCYLLNGETGAGVQIGGFSDSSAQKFFVGIGKNTNGDYVGIQGISAGTGLYWWNLGPSLASAYIKESGTLTYGGTKAGDQNCFTRSPSNPNYIFVFVSPAYVFDLTKTSGTVPSFATSGTPNTLGNALSSVLIVDATKANTDFGSVGIRATGVKTTA